VVHDEGDDRGHSEGSADTDGDHDERHEQDRRVGGKQPQAGQAQGHEQLARGDHEAHCRNVERQDGVG
jgi:hypothetical protein